MSGQLGGLCWAEPGQDLGGCRGGTLVFEHVVYVAADEHRLVHLFALDAAEPRAAQQRAHAAAAGKRESSRRPGLLAEAGYRRGLGEPSGKDGVLLACAPAKERQPAAATQRLPQFANAVAGSSKNMTPKLLSTTSKIPAPNGCTWASTTSNLALMTPAAAASRRASAT